MFRITDNPKYVDPNFGGMPPPPTLNDKSVNSAYLNMNCWVAIEGYGQEKTEKCLIILDDNFADGFGFIVVT